MNKEIKIHEGTSGNGHTIYLAVTVDTLTGKWLHVENFDTMEEANCWKKWA